MHGELPMAGRTGVKSGGEPRPCPPRRPLGRQQGTGAPAATDQIGQERSECKSAQTIAQLALIPKRNSPQAAPTL